MKQVSSWQVVGIEGHNPSGHCLVASKLVDSIPSSVVDNENLNPAKKQAFDKENQPTDLPSKQRELSMVCMSYSLFADESAE